MYKDREKQKEAVKKAVTKHREGITQGITGKEGITPKGITSEGITGQPDIIDKLTNPIWRKRLEKICHAFNSSNHPEYAHDVMLGVAVTLDERAYRISEVCELLETTR